MFEEIDILPVISSTVQGEPCMTGYTMAPTPISKSAQCVVCHRARHNRIHLVAERDDSGRWPL